VALIQPAKWWLSAASVWEMSIKSSLGRLTLPEAQAHADRLAVVTKDSVFRRYGVTAVW
jgi:PIN domain nuclease of toxin-antitoxin system